MKDALDMVMSQPELVELQDQRDIMENTILYRVRLGSVDTELAKEYREWFQGFYVTLGEKLQEMAEAEPEEAPGPVSEFDGECTTCGKPRPSSKRQRLREKWVFRKCSECVAAKKKAERKPRKTSNKADDNASGPLNVSREDNCMNCKAPPSNMRIEASSHGNVAICMLCGHEEFTTRPED